MLVRLERALNRSSDAAVRTDLAALPGHLDRADAYLAEGTIGGEPPNVADLQIASGLRLLMTLDDLRETIAQRPCGQLALRLWPDYPGRMPSGSLAGHAPAHG
jgi:glutathione S-transferase